MVTWIRACLTDAVRWAWMDYICAASAIKPYRILQVVSMVTGSDLLDILIAIPALICIGLALKDM